jgi:hypothetical protein
MNACSTISWYEILVQFVLQADDVRALIQDAMPPVSQPPTLQKSQLMT